MAALPQRLKTSADIQQNRQPNSHLRTEAASEASLECDGEDIPIFCAGGCGEVMGFVKKGQSIPTSRCRRCEAAETARKMSLAKTEALPASIDELAELRAPPRDLRLIHIVQVIAVALIFTGSVCIAMGRPLGIYLAAVGSFAWVAVALVLWKLRS